MKNDMKMRLGILFCCSMLFSACMTEDLHTMLRNQEDHEIRIQTFEAMCKTFNETVLTMQAIAEGSASGDYLTGITETETGYTLTFAHRGTFTLYHGKKGETGDKGETGADGNDGADGADGADGENGMDGVNAPLIGMKEENGVLYWTQTVDGVTTWLLSFAGERMKVNGDKGEPGTDGKPGEDGINPVPVLGIDKEGYWLLNGERIKDVNGAEVKAKGPQGAPGKDGADAPSGIPGPGLFEKVEVGGESVLFELKEPAGTQFVLPRYVPLTFSLQATDIPDFNFRENRTYTYEGTGIQEIYFIAPARWRALADLKMRQITIQAPAADEPNREMAGTLTILVFDGKGQSLRCACPVAITVK